MDDQSFGSSIAKSSKPSNRLPSHKPHVSFSASASYRQPQTGLPSTSYSSFIKPATPNAFTKSQPNYPPKQQHRPQGAPFAPPFGYTDDPYIRTRPQPAISPFYHGPQPPHGPLRPNPSGVNSHNGRLPPAPPKPKADEEGEYYDLRTANITAEDMKVYDGDSEKHMRQLLSGAIGEEEGIEAGSDVVEGFKDDIRLMPHQVRGVSWMKKRETGRNTGGILADDMGLGKSVQVLARVVEGEATAAQKKAGFHGTLVVAPVAVMEQWVGEVKNKTRSLKVTTHHGPSRAKLGAKLAKFDIVITTFQTLASEHGKYIKVKADTQQKLEDMDSSDEEEERTKKSKSKVTAKDSHALFEVKWLRVVIDEAQNIKNHNTKAAKASCELDAKYRWCLSGTPIQNKVEELYSLFRFLRIKPLNSWEVFKAQIVGPMKDGRTKFAMKRLSVLLKAVMLRRTKDATIDGAPILKLPGRTVNIITCPFDAGEKAFYEELETRMSAKLDKLQMTEAANSYTSVLVLLLRLRQACLHPSLVGKSAGADMEAYDGGIDRPVDVDAEDEEADELAGLLDNLAVDTNKPKPEKESAPPTSFGAGRERDSAKIRMLLKILSDIEGRKEGEKTIVFSQFTGFLDILEPFLKANGIRFVRYDGSMKNDKRQESLETIKSSTSVRVILISFKAGSTGLNLTCCNNVVLMDLWWNPALEDQAFDRAHRLGQQRDVNIFKLIVEETVEDRILTLQNAKRELAKAALSGDAAGNFTKLTMADMLNLFKSHGRHDDDEDEDESD